MKSMWNVMFRGKWNIARKSHLRVQEKLSRRPREEKSQQKHLKCYKRLHNTEKLSFYLVTTLSPLKVFMEQF